MSGTAPARIAVVGAGAIGGIVAARLAALGHRVSVVARGAHLEAIRADGLVLEAIDGTRVHAAVDASDDPADLGPQDAIVIGLKGPAIPAMLPRLAPMLGPDTFVVPAINGVPWWYFHGDAHAPRALASPRHLEVLDPGGAMFAALDPARIVGCVVHLAGEIPRPGTVRHTGGWPMIVGEPDGSQSARVNLLAGWFAACGFEARATTHVRLEIWTKLIGNLSVNPVAALTGLRMDRILADSGLVGLVGTLMEEGKQVAAAVGVPLSIDIPRRLEMARGIGAVRPSTLQDFEAGRRPELEGLAGAVIELADRAGLAVPTLRHVYSLVLARARHLGLI